MPFLHTVLWPFVHSAANAAGHTKYKPQTFIVVPWFPKQTAESAKHKFRNLSVVSWGLTFFVTTACSSHLGAFCMPAVASAGMVACMYHVVPYRCACKGGTKTVHIYYSRLCKWKNTGSHCYKKLDSLWKFPPHKRGCSSIRYCGFYRELYSICTPAENCTNASIRAGIKWGGMPTSGPAKPGRPRSPFSPWKIMELLRLEM